MSEYYEENYDFLCGQRSNFQEGDPEALLGNAEERICRFCGKSFPQVSFKKDAHVFPRCTGNVNLLSTYECDVCNGFFGNTLESEYSNLFNFSHTIYEVAGRRNKIPMLQSNDNKSKLKVVKHPEKEGSLHMINEERGSIHTKIDIERFEEKIIDLSSCEKIKVEKQSRSFTAGNVVELTEEARKIMTTNKYAQMIQQEIRKSSNKHQ